MLLSQRGTLPGLFRVNENVFSVVEELLNLNSECTEVSSKMIKLWQR